MKMKTKMMWDFNIRIVSVNVGALSMIKCQKYRYHTRNVSQVNPKDCATYILRKTLSFWMDVLYCLKVSRYSAFPSTFPLYCNNTSPILGYWVCFAKLFWKTCRLKLYNSTRNNNVNHSNNALKLSKSLAHMSSYLIWVEVFHMYDLPWDKKM